jgi:4-hydroxy-tetrahydrodipicolinate reductase
MRIAIAGAGGRMGRVLTRLVHETAGCRVSGALERTSSDLLGQDAGVLAGIGPLGVAVSADADAVLNASDAIIDFTTPEASLALARHTAALAKVHVIGTTGIGGDASAALQEAAQGATIIKSGNMSLGVNLLAVMVRQVAAALGEDFDIEILEMHHRHKVDAPSGTALLLGEAAARGRRIALGEKSVRVRDGQTGPRQPGTIGFATLRGGSVVGDHRVIFAGAGERIELSHHAENRDLFGRGAVRAALWGKGRPAGLYSMLDVLGLE